MPGYRKHMMGGLCVYGIGLYLVRGLGYRTFSFTVMLEWLLCSIAGSLFPDIDVKSKGQYYFYSVMMGVLVLLILHKQHSIASCMGVVALMPLLVRHRGVCHRWWFVTGVPLLVWLMVSRIEPTLSRLIWYDTLFFIAGALSHLWLDLGLRRMMRL